MGKVVCHLGPWRSACLLAFKQATHTPHKLVLLKQGRAVATSSPKYSSKECQRALCHTLELYLGEFAVFTAKLGGQASPIKYQKSGGQCSWMLDATRGTHNIYRMPKRQKHDNTQLHAPTCARGPTLRTAMANHPPSQGSWGGSAPGTMRPQGARRTRGAGGQSAGRKAWAPTAEQYRWLWTRCTPAHTHTHTHTHTYEL